ncbi:aromatic ring-hydroxylating dioxygenase subunit alpha [Hephaestia mangrovi]|uniref:aromatic ring-hydroxylating dioxygenase subunit alpha n=1 Tax=Hephaestia mangrovi TaxID=2873268 RepID=UPI001CA69FA5|nr:aromatic ring-hydroxylating dioxygenase subunit alpha [Hephaestia mangrovi]MBY8829389.1 aromatic ring-hydroxylating dioxygenase subunit alpha [Hephaestia mangrovi]
MLDKAKNRLLTDVEPGSAMGDYLRRYWHPIAGAADFDQVSIKPIRLFGENLVLYKDLSGTFGLVERQCAHRSADLAYGFVEKCGIRCNYHGWLYDQGGRCLEQPYEQTVLPNSKYRDKIRLKSYPVREKAGLLFAYLGEGEPPCLPDWEPFSRSDGFVQVVTADVPCNWFQCQENSIDPVHFEWMHSNWSARMRDPNGAFGPQHIKLGFDEFEHGFIYKRIRNDTDESDPLWTVGRVLLWPNGFFLGNHFEWRVPVDNENTLSVSWIYAAVPENRRPYRQNHIPSWKSPIVDPETGRWITTHVINQDIVGWVGQGRITDRGRENLGQSDKGIVMVRNRFLRELDAVAAGERPKGLITDEAMNHRVTLPVANRLSLGANAVTAKFILHAGQPAEVRAACEEAMGFEIDAGGLT